MAFEKIAGFSVDMWQYFEDNTVFILDWEDRWFDRAMKQAICAKLEQLSLNRGGDLWHQ